MLAQPFCALVADLPPLYSPDVPVEIVLFARMHSVAWRSPVIPFPHVRAGTGRVLSHPELATALLMRSSSRIWV